LADLGFRPLGRIPFAAESVTIGLDELEAIRLADLEGLYQDAAAEQMGVSRQTYARILTRARAAVARSLVEQRMLLVRKGAAPSVVHESPELSGCPVHAGPRRHGRACRCPAAEADAPPPCRRPARPSS
jgi:predicted DNA-binding protein (UPF0251 family)